MHPRVKAAIEANTHVVVTDVNGNFLKWEGCPELPPANDSNRNPELLLGSEQYRGL